MSLFPELDDSTAIMLPDQRIVGNHTLHHGEARQVLRLLPDSSLDACVTDPPYGLRFMGARWDYDIPGVLLWHELLRVMKPGAHLLAFGGSRTYHRLAVAIEDAGWEIRDSIFCWMHGQGFPKSRNITGGALDGWGSALKPAVEPIILARKPMLGTMEENVQAFGTGALNIDACRIDVPGATGRAYRTTRLRPGASIDRERGNWHASGEQYIGKVAAGRWPTNVIMVHAPDCALDGPCVDGCPVALLARQSGTRRSGSRISGDEPSACVDKIFGKRNRTRFSGYRDTGTAVRFYPSFYHEHPDADPFLYTGKPSRAERNAGCVIESSEPVTRFGATLRNCEEAAWDERNGNPHPTVKPIAVMRWLARLITPPGGVLIDPFAGSGTTGCAAGIEGFSSVLIEREADYLPVIEARVRHWSGAGNS